jgi:hypothetical protein
MLTGQYTDSFAKLFTDKEISMSANVNSATSTNGSVQRVAYGNLWRVGLLAIVIAVIANVIVYFVGVQLVTVPPEFLPLTAPIPAIIFTTVGMIAATVAFAIVGRFTRQPVRVYTIVAIVALLLSLIPNILMIIDPSSVPFPGANVGNVMVLIVMHFVAAAVAIWVLTTRGVERVPAAM